MGQIFAQVPELGATFNQALVYLFFYLNMQKVLLLFLAFIPQSKEAVCKTPESA